MILRMFQTSWVILAANLVLGSTLHAQFRLDISQLAAASSVADEVQVEPEAPQGGNQFRVQQNIDAWAFNQHGNALQARKFLDRQLKAKIGNYTEQFKLSSQQEEKLTMAGQSDIAAYFAEIEVIRSEFGDNVNQAEFQKVWQRVQPLQMRMQVGLFSKDSLLAKVIHRTLDQQQRVQHEARERERLEFAYRAAVKLTLSELEKTVSLLADQRNQILELLVKTDPPKVGGQYINYFVLYRLAQARQELNEILKPGQQKAIAQTLNQGQAMAQFLKQNGFID